MCVHIELACSLPSIALSLSLSLHSLSLSLSFSLSLSLSHFDIYLDLAVLFFICLAHCLLSLLFRLSISLSTLLLTKQRLVQDCSFLEDTPTRRHHIGELS